MATRDWRLPEHRREAFQRFYSFHLKFRSHPGSVYYWLPAIADGLELDADQRAWLVWLNGNTQNPVTSLLLLEAAPDHTQWQKAVDFWNEHFKLLEWDTDRRHQKSKFGVATEQWAGRVGAQPAAEWAKVGMLGWADTWAYAKDQPYMGRLSAWSMTEYARILFGDDVPDADTLLLEDKSGSRSHRNALGLLYGRSDAVYWEANEAPELLPELVSLGESLLTEARERNPGHPDVTRLTLESALCTWKSWHKPNRRYPNCYTDMSHARLRKAESRFGERFGLLWDARAQLPDYLLLEKTPGDPGMVSEKQNHYLSTGEPIMMHREWPDMANGFNTKVEAGGFAARETPSPVAELPAVTIAPPVTVPVSEDPLALTPVQLRDGLWYKREDLFRLPNGVNGSKLRACFYLVGQARAAGAMEVVSAASVQSPQSPMGATVAARLGLSSVTIVGGTTPEKAVKHKTIALAVAAGSEVVSIPVGYNPALQSAARKFVKANPGTWKLPYGITTPPGSSLEEIRSFVEVGAAQVWNLPDEIETLVLPFGSGNTAAGVLYGLMNYQRPSALKLVVLMTIGPDKFDWLDERLTDLGWPLLGDHGVNILRLHLHPTFATYGDRMPETLDDIVLHPTYEGKVVRYLNHSRPGWWTARDGKTLLWIVGGPL